MSALSVGNGRQVLLVDDDEGNLLTMSALLEDEGFVVHTANSVASARTKLSEVALQLRFAMLDHNLGDGTGLDLVPLLREKASTARIIIVSGEAHSLPATPKVDCVIAKGEAFDVLLHAVVALLPRE